MTADQAEVIIWLLKGVLAILTLWYGDHVLGHFSSTRRREQWFTVGRSRDDS